MMVRWAALVFCIGQVLAQNNILTNGDFENQTAQAAWLDANCEAEFSTDSHSGAFSYHVKDRGAHWAASRQSLLAADLSLTKRYFGSAWMKLLSDPLKRYRLKITIATQIQTATEPRWKHQAIDSGDTFSSADGWVNIAAEFTMRDWEFPVLQYRIYAETRNASGPDENYPAYLLDDFEISEMVTNAKWREDAWARIEEHRKSNLSIIIHGKTNTPGYTGATVTLRQLNSQFGFGSNVDSYLLKNNEKYRDTFLNNFEWGQLQTSMSWRETEYNKNLLVWKDADQGMKVLEDHEKRIRGGSIHEAEKDRMPEFVKKMFHPDDIYRSSMKRVDDLLSRYRYRCEHWDVVDEMESQNNFLSLTYGSNKINTDLYRRAQEVDYAAKLFVNDDNLLPTDTKITNVMNNIRRMKEQNAPVQGIGAKSVFSSFPNGELIIHRLNRLAAAKLPVWLTEYAFSSANVTERAIAFYDVMLAAISAPNVEGIMLRDYWDGHSAEANSSFFDGEDFQVNPAGAELRSLVSTMLESNNKDLNVIDIAAGDEVTLDTERLYHGVYEITITRATDDRVFRTTSVPLFRHEGDREVHIWI